jgi:hypothetical protein
MLRLVEVTVGEEFLAMLRVGQVVADDAALVGGARLERQNDNAG